MKNIQEIYNEAMDKGKKAYIPYFTSKKMVKDIVDFDIMAFKYVPVEYKTKEFCLYACQRNVYAYFFIPERYKTNRRILYAVLSQWGMMLEHCPDWVKSRKEFVIIAAKNNMNALKFANPNIFKDKSIAKELVYYKPAAIKYFPKFNNDVEVCKYILNLNPEFKHLVGPAVIDFYKKEFLKVPFFHEDNKNRPDSYWDAQDDD